MKKFIQSNVTPIGGYKFTDPDDGFEYNRHYRNFIELENHVIIYRTQNKLPILRKFRIIWEAFVCENVTLMKNKCCPVEKLVERSFSQYYKGAKAFFKTLIQQKFASQEQADARSETCRRCSENVVKIGHKQFYSDLFMISQVGNRRSKNHKDLHTCDVCSCILKAKVFYDSKIISEYVTAKELETLKRKPIDSSTGRYLKCWQLSEFEEQSSVQKEKTT